MSDTSGRNDGAANAGKTIDMTLSGEIVGVRGADEAPGAGFAGPGGEGATYFEAQFIAGEARQGNWLQRLAGRAMGLAFLGGVLAVAVAGAVFAMWLAAILLPALLALALIGWAGWRLGLLRPAGISVRRGRFGGRF